MVETAALLSFYLAFALVHAADPRRSRVRGSRPAPGLSRALRLAAVIQAIAGVALWTRAEGLAAALLVGVSALSTAATVVVLLAPLAPRLVWSVALVCPPAIVALLLAGGSP